MKRIFLFLLCFVLSQQVVVAQSPQKMSYQCVVRNAGNSLVANLPVGIRISILQGSSTGTSVYTETHLVNTNVNGLAAIEIGGGSAVSGTFSLISWANGPYFVKSETDPNGGTNYSIAAVNQLLSVPYALYAVTSGTAGSQNAWSLTGNTGTNPTTNFIGTTDSQHLIIKTNNAERMRITSAGNIGIGTNASLEKLHISGNMMLSGSIKAQDTTQDITLIPGANANINASNKRIKNVAAVVDSSDAVNAIAIQSQQLTFGNAGGSTNAYSLSLSPAPTAYVAGMMLTFKANAANTGAATLNVNNLGNVALKKNVTNNLAAGDIAPGQMVIAIYDGTNFQTMNINAASSTNTGASKIDHTLIYTTDGF